MIYLTVISEENYRIKYSHWDTDPDEEYTIIDRHIFIYSPDKDQPIIPSLIGNYDIKTKELLSGFYHAVNGYNKDSLLGIKLHEIIGEKFDGTPSSQTLKQTIDIENTRNLCENLNRCLDFTLYVPCFYVDPYSVGNKESHDLGRGNSLESISPNYFPSPFCRLSSYERCAMKELSKSDFLTVNFDSIKSKRSKFVYNKYVSWKENRRILVDKYLSGEIIPDEDEEDMYENWVDEVKEEDLEIERYLSGNIPLDEDEDEMYDSYDD